MKDLRESILDDDDDILGNTSNDMKEATYGKFIQSLAKDSRLWSWKSVKPDSNNKYVLKTLFSPQSELLLNAPKDINKYINGIDSLHIGLGEKNRQFAINRLNDPLYSETGICNHLGEIIDGNYINKNLNFPDMKINNNLADVNVQTIIYEITNPKDISKGAFDKVKSKDKYVHINLLIGGSIKDWENNCDKLFNNLPKHHSYSLYIDFDFNDAYDTSFINANISDLKNINCDRLHIRFVGCFNDIHSPEGHRLFKPKPEYKKAFKELYKNNPKVDQIILTKNYRYDKSKSYLINKQTGSFKVY